MALRAVPMKYVYESGVRNAAVDFTDLLDGDEVLTGTPTVVDVNATGDLTIASIRKNTAAIVVNGRTVAINKAVQFSVSGFDADATYTLRVTCATDATPAQTLPMLLRLRAQDDGT